MLSSWFLWARKFGNRLARQPGLRFLIRLHSEMTGATVIWRLDWAGGSLPRWLTHMAAKFLMVFGKRLQFPWQPSHRLDYSHGNTGGWLLQNKWFKMEQSTICSLLWPWLRSHMLLLLVVRGQSVSKPGSRRGKSGSTFEWSGIKNVWYDLNDGNITLSLIFF